MKTIKFFKVLFDSLEGFDDEVSFLELAKNVKYEMVQANRPVFQQGDPSNQKFYVILSGTAAVISRKNWASFFKQPNKEERRESLKPHEKEKEGDQTERVQTHSTREGINPIVENASRDGTPPGSPSHSHRTARTLLDASNLYEINSSVIDF